MCFTREKGRILEPFREKFSVRRKMLKLEAVQHKFAKPSKRVGDGLNVCHLLHFALKQSECRLGLAVPPPIVGQ